MSQLSLYQALLIFSWFPLAFTLAVIMLIARFYERFSATRTYWWLYVIPIIGYAGAVVREAAMGQLTDPIASVLQAISGATLIALTAHLSLYMLRHKATPAQMATAPPLLAVISLVGPLGLGFALLMLARFTRRMVMLNRQPVYHRLYYVSIAIIATACIVRIYDEVSPEALLFYAGLMVTGSTLAAVTSWRTWSWLLAERA